MKAKTYIASLILAACALPVFAQTPPPPKNPAATPGIDQRMVNQEKRIDQGVQSGALTSKEAARLDKREDKLASDVAAAKADGKVTKAERARLQREAHRDSRAIYREKHDRQHDFNHDGKKDHPRRRK